MLSNRLTGIAVAGKSNFSSNVLKNCCRVEALQLSNIAKLELALVVYMVVAWRLARLVRLGRNHQDLAASALFTEAEWKGAYEIPPQQLSLLRECLSQIESDWEVDIMQANGSPHRAHAMMADTIEA